MDNYIFKEPDVFYICLNECITKDLIIFIAMVIKKVYSGGIRPSNVTLIIITCLWYNC